MVVMSLNKNINKSKHIINISLDDFNHIYYGSNIISDFDCKKSMISKNDSLVLLTLWKFIRPTIALEFGINKGYTAKLLLKNSPCLTKYIGIDVPFNYVANLEIQQREITKDVGCYVNDDQRVKVYLLKGGSKSLNIEKLPKADFIFIDGDHSIEGVINDSLMAKQLISQNGVICWHDYKNVREVTEVLTFLRYNYEWNIVHVKDTYMCYEIQSNHVKW